MRAVVGRDLKDASMAGFSEDRRFATAYNAALQLATMAIACAGCRVSTKQGHHENTFLALELAMGNSVTKFAQYLNVCRKKRNLVDYNLANVVTETELQELLKKAAEFQALVENWIFDNYPLFV